MLVQTSRTASLCSTSRWHLCAPALLAACCTDASEAFMAYNESIGCISQDPLAIIGIVSILLPFIILGIAIGTGVVDVSAGSSYGKP